MYVPGFSPYLEGMMGVAPSQSFQSVSAPVSDPSQIQFMSLGDFYNLINSEHQAALPEMQGAPYRSMFPTLSGAAPIEDVSGLAFRGSDNDTLNISNFVRSDPNATFRLVDGGGNVIYEGVGDDALRQAYVQSRDISQTDAGKANWTLLKGGQGGAWTPVASDRPEQSALGTFAKIALPTIGGVLLGPALAGLGAGSSATGAAGAAGGALGSAGGALGGAAAPLGSIIVSGSSLTPALAGGLAGLGTGALGAMSPLTANTSFVPQMPNSPPPLTTGGDIVVTGSTPSTSIGGAAIAPGVAGGAFGATGASGVPETVGNPITVTAPNQPNPGALGTMAPVVAGGGALAGLGGVSGSPTAADPAKPPKSTLDKITDILEAAGLGAGLIGSLFGGGQGQGALNTIPGGLGSGQLNPVFNRPLPASSMGSLNQRAVTDDWATYGYRPERSFFDNVPLNPVGDGRLPQPTGPSGPPMGVVPDNMRFAMGGEVDFAVRGPGTGRSDEIPALLSDGEYVIDAETVALLGDGSSEAGAQRLDEMRESVRRHKGQQLAKGKFSPDAKAPEHYLRGGRT